MQTKVRKNVTFAGVIIRIILSCLVRRWRYCYYQFCPQIVNSKKKRTKRKIIEVLVNLVFLYCYYGRWYTYLNSDFKKGGWSPEEDMLLCEVTDSFYMHKLYVNLVELKI